MPPNRANTRIAFVTPSRARGWRSQPLLREFSKLFPKTVVFTGIWPGFIRGYEGTIEVRQLRGIKFVTLRRGASCSDSGFAWVSPLALWDLLRFRPQVIFTNGFHLCALYALLVKAFLGSRLILLWQGVSPETGGSRGSVRLWVRQIMAPFFDLSICNTRDGVEYLQNLAGIPRSKVWHRVCEVADRDALCMNAGIEVTLGAKDHPMFLFVGAMIRGKGVHKLLEACSLLAQQRFTHFSVVLVGDGAQKQDFCELSRVLGIEDRVRWEGHVRYENLGAYYQACDVFVLPSLEDTWGVVALEAMVFGKPILCSRYAGSKEVTQDRVNGFIFDAYNAAELADYMARFIREPDLIAKFGEASKEISAQYTPQQVAGVLGGAVAMLMHSERAILKAET